MLTTRGWSLPAMRERNEARGLVQVTILGAVDPGAADRPTAHANEAQCQCTTAPRGPQGMPPPRRGESMQQPRRDRHDSSPRGYSGAIQRQSQPQASGWAGQPAPPIVGLGLEAMHGMTKT